MYSKPDMTAAVDRFAHFLSELHNDDAPIGWERYRPLAIMLMRKFPITDIINDSKFLDVGIQWGVQDVG